MVERHNMPLKNSDKWTIALRYRWSPPNTSWCLFMINLQQQILEYCVTSFVHTTTKFRGPHDVPIASKVNNTISTMIAVRTICMKTPTLKFWSTAEYIAIPPLHRCYPPCLDALRLVHSRNIAPTQLKILVLAESRPHLFPSINLNGFMPLINPEKSPSGSSRWRLFIDYLLQGRFCHLVERKTPLKSRCIHIRIWNNDQGRHKRSEA